MCRLFLLLPLLLLALAPAPRTQRVFLPLALNAPQLPPPTMPTPEPTGPVLLLLPADMPEPQHVLAAFAVGCHPSNANCYYFAIIKFRGGNQDALLLRLRPGAERTELVVTVDQGAQFIGPIALGSGVLLPDGSVDLAFSACYQIPDDPFTGCGPFRWRIVGVDAPFGGARIVGDHRAVEVVK